VCASIITTGCATARIRAFSYLDAENAYADAQLEPIKPLIDELAAELKAREA
jgi:hypothetical protein